MHICKVLDSASFPCILDPFYDNSYSHFECNESNRNTVRQAMRQYIVNNATDISIVWDWPEQLINEYCEDEDLVKNFNILLKNTVGLEIKTQRKRVNNILGNVYSLRKLKFDSYESIVK